MNQNNYYNNMEWINRNHYPSYSTQLYTLHQNQIYNIPELDFNEFYEYVKKNNPELTNIIDENREEFVKIYQKYIQNMPQESIDALRFYNRQIDWANEILSQVEQRQVILDDVISQLKNRTQYVSQSTYENILKSYQVANHLQYGIALNLENKHTTNLVKEYIEDAKKFAELATIYFALGVGAIKAGSVKELVTTLVEFGIGYLLFSLYNVSDKVKEKLDSIENKITTIEKKNEEQENIIKEIDLSQLIPALPEIPLIPEIPKIPETPVKPSTPSEPLKVIGSTTIRGNYPSEPSFFAYWSFTVTLDLYNNGEIYDDFKVYFFNKSMWKNITITVSFGSILRRDAGNGYSRITIPYTYSWDGINIYDRHDKGESKYQGSIKFLDSDLDPNAVIRMKNENLVFTLP